ncbi:MAG: hypothetical protein HY074_06220 [Deltaproteobacteria bacterium]|nr:hypothetical protein [Deltaproteobacteria bacterium]
MKFITFLFLITNLAFAGGGSEVGDGHGHGSRASSPVPVPVPVPPGYPDGGGSRQLPLFSVISVRYSAAELKAGETLTVTIVANGAYYAPSPTKCGAVLKSPDLTGIAIPFESCKVSRNEDLQYQLVLVHQFPARTPSREYFIGDVKVNRAAVPLIAAKRIHVHGSQTLGDLDLVSSILTTDSGTQVVKYGRDFFFDATFRTDGVIARIALTYVVDQGTGLEDKTMVLDMDTGFTQQQDSLGLTLVRVALMTEMANVRHVELRRISVLNSSFQAASFTLPEAFVVDFE